ncbi:hypothetical protein [Ralstonia phage p2110]|nr:hypothetical protein [Ralstonia phage p2110]
MRGRCCVSRLAACSVLDGSRCWRISLRIPSSITTPPQVKLSLKARLQPRDHGMVIGEGACLSRLSAGVWPLRIALLAISFAPPLYARCCNGVPSSPRLRQRRSEAPTSQRIDPLAKRPAQTLCEWCPSLRAVTFMIRQQRPRSLICIADESADSLGVWCPCYSGLSAPSWPAARTLPTVSEPVWARLERDSIVGAKPLRHKDFSYVVAPTPRSAHQSFSSVSNGSK